MNALSPLPPAILKRKAVVYVRQSTQSQVLHNLESQRSQYDLVNTARRHGFQQVEVIDDDLGRSASGAVARPGFERLVAWLCAGDVGAVLCLDASRLARNGRDWHHLLELCGLADARVIDQDGKVENRPVAVGDWYGDQWFINDGLKAGDQVVVDGALRLKAGGTARITAAAPAASAASAAPAASAAQP
jgi:hypothetical protein